MQVKEAIRERCPRTLWIRKALAHAKMRQYFKYVLPEKTVLKAEANFEFKMEIVEKYTKEWLEYSRAVDSKIDTLLDSAPAYRVRNDLGPLRIDMKFCRFAYGFQPDEYLTFHLEGADCAKRREYISDLEKDRYLCRMNDVVDFVLFMDKAKTYERYSPYYKRDAVSLSGPKDFERFASFAEKHPTFVRKRVDLSKGDSVELVEFEAYKGSPRSFFDGLVSEGRYIVEELVSQSETMSAINSSSVNTVRCITFNTKHGIVTPFCFLKTGRQGSFVDNGGAGGLLVGVDKNTGVLCTDGFDEYGQVFSEHPDSNVRFKGVRLPDWEDMLEMCKEMSSLEPRVKYIGWDMAHTDDGWIVIEGNSRGQMIGPQIVWQRGIKADVEALMENMDLLA
ncbi:hypothetical protein GS424_013950 [Eggerthella guodeyinii]|uniref:Alpha-L-glutamate ligase-related protein ATP-grasp domain-containing protein n=1 Tax=Eggerthella guodeyinii TaxID=2690837 RepID=A0A6L7IN87_9ACTN|nr:sugar-transfer associated ATP-grasp domain-containing protein [Eggerthella guodeyinii]QOS67603.1 hypothetical protein GS424_013950 [Eggerthella guodeyinii]